MAKIEASTKIVEILRNYPRAADYLLELGICGCEISSVKDANATVAEEVSKKKLDLVEVLEELNRRVQGAALVI